MPRRTTGPAGRRLTKADAEALLRVYDTDPVGALAAALGKLLDRDGSWPELVAAAPFDDTRRAALLAGDEQALDALAADLNELRSLP